MIVSLPESVQYNIYAVWMISVITDASFAKYTIAMSIAQTTYRSDATSGSQHHMSAIPAIRKNFAGRISIFIRLSMLMLQ